MVDDENDEMEAQDVEQNLNEPDEDARMDDENGSVSIPIANGTTRVHVSGGEDVKPEPQDKATDAVEKRLKASAAKLIAMEVWPLRDFCRKSRKGTELIGVLEETKLLYDVSLDIWINS